MTVTTRSPKHANMVTSEVSRNNVLAVLPYQTLNKILGEPTYSQMKRWFKQMSVHLILVATTIDWGQGKGYLCLLQHPAVSTAQNGAAYNPLPNEPSAYPTIPSNATMEIPQTVRSKTQG